MFPDASCNDPRLVELFLEWEDSREAGSELSIEEVCADVPELASALRDLVARLSAVDRRLTDPNAGHVTEGIVHPAKPVHSSSLPTIPGFEFLDEIGRGGMGIVYRARQLSVGNRLVAIKTVPAEGWTCSALIGRLRGEISALSKLNHENVVKVFDVIEHREQLYLVLEYVDGGSLRSERQPGTAMPPRVAAEIARTIAETMDDVHKSGILHRDLKPGNILRTSRGQIKITDFGLAKHLTAESSNSAIGDVAGSPSFMAPEQASGCTAEATAQIDVYAIGATLYDLLTGRPPFAGATLLDTLDQVRRAEPVRPQQLVPHIPRDLETICLKCLEKNPALRFSTARELADELGRFIRGEPIRSRPIGRLSRIVRWCWRRPTIAMLILITTVGSGLMLSGRAAYKHSLSKANSKLTTAGQSLEVAIAETRKEQARTELVRRKAVENEQRVAALAYVAGIRLAAESLRVNDVRATRDALHQLIPASGQTDYRGFEWWYLRQRVERMQRVILQLEGAIYFIQFSPDRRLLAATGKDATVHLLDPSTGKLVREISTGQLEVNSVAFSPDGRELATAGDDASIRFWNVETGAPTRQIDKALDNKVFQLAFTPGGRLIAAGNVAPIKIFDPESGRPLGALPGHPDVVQSIAVDPTGRWLASTGGDQHVRVWDLFSSTQSLAVASTHQTGPLVFVPDRNLVIAGADDGTIRSWNLRSGAELGHVRHLDNVGALALHPGGKLLAAGDSRGAIRLWRLDQEGRFTRDSPEIWTAHQGAVFSLIWDDDGSRLLSAGADGRVISWSLDEVAQRQIKHFDVGNGPHTSFCVLPASQQLVIAGPEPRGLDLYDHSAGISRQLLDSPTYNLVCASPDGRFVAAIKDRDGPANIRIFPVAGDFHKLPGDRCIASWHFHGSFRRLKYARDGRSVAAPFEGIAPNGTHDRNVAYLFSLPDTVTPDRIPLSGIVNLDFCPTAHELILSTGSEVLRYDVEHQRSVWAVSQSHDEELQVSPDGVTFATGGGQRVVTVRHSTDGTVHHRLLGHLARISSLAYAPDSRTLASSSLDGVIKLWHLPTGQELFDLTQLGDPYARIEFTSDGQGLVGLLNGSAKDEIVVFRAEHLETPGGQ